MEWVGNRKAFQLSTIIKNGKKVQVKKTIEFTNPDGTSHTEVEEQVLDEWQHAEELEVPEFRTRGMSIHWTKPVSAVEARD